LENKRANEEGQYKRNSRHRDVCGWAVAGGLWREFVDAVHGSHDARRDCHTSNCNRDTSNCNESGTLTLTIGDRGSVRRVPVRRYLHLLTAEGDCRVQRDD
jgi:hypothetical protein